MSICQPSEKSLQLMKHWLWGGYGDTLAAKATWSSSHVLKIQEKQQLPFSPAIDSQIWEIHIW